mmetsp:Transcript_11307/g.28524  ORF Transcript_11307/g.28524 Transcript_11307/m.28524 type:complete len:82 (-) Transcript_11307:409-654(-)
MEKWEQEKILLEDELRRLENSVKKLKETNEALEIELEKEEDPVLREALEENLLVIPKQCNMIKEIKESLGMELSGQLAEST